MSVQGYVCVKCSNNEYDVDEIRTTGSGISRFLNMQNQKFAAVTCKKCSYVEFYRLGSGGAMGKVFDFLSGQLNSVIRVQTDK